LAGFLKQYEIAVDPAKLMANNITINDVFSSLENNNQNTGGAYIEKGPTVLFIRSEGLGGQCGRHSKYSSKKSKQRFTSFNP
jgi:cobalt-zinc-cadmium resistance protein CzcA